MNNLGYQNLNFKISVTILVTVLEVEHNLNNILFRYQKSMNYFRKYYIAYYRIKKGGNNMKDTFKGKRLSNKPIGFKQEKIGHTSVKASDDEEFKSFFEEVISRLPKKTTTPILNAYDKSKVQAEKIIDKTRVRFDAVFEEFLEGVDIDVRKKAHATIHAASLTSAIIGCSPIPFSDAFLLVPVQLTMMSRLHKLFGQSWSDAMGMAITRELVVVGLGRSVVGNLMKLIPGVGTIAGAAINGTVATTITQALGWVTVKQLNEGVDIFDDVMSMKNQFEGLVGALKGSDKSKKK